MSELLDLARKAAELAKAKGASDASASTWRSRDVDLTWRDGKVEKVSEATTRGLSLAVYVDGRYSAVSTSDLRAEALPGFVEEAVALARTLAKDPYRALPDPKLYEGRAKLDLELFDRSISARTPEARRGLARSIEEAARAAPGAATITSVTTSVSDNHSLSARVTTNGFEGERESTSFSLSADVSVKDDDGRRPEDWSSASARFFADLPQAALVGRDAAERALGARGSKKTESAVTTVIVENRAARKLVGALLGPLAGRSLQQKQSFLDGQLGKSVGSKLLTVIDDPWLPRGLGSRLWDGDGIAARRLPVIEAGVLKTYYIDVYYGRKLQAAPTTGGSSNLVFSGGKKDLAALLGDVKDGVLITSFLGGNSNGTTGDYSFGIQGYRIRGGKRAEPIGEMNVSGNQKELWKKLAAVGSDPYVWASTRTPTLVFEGVQVAGL